MKVAVDAGYSSNYRKVPKNGSSIKNGLASGMGVLHVVHAEHHIHHHI